MARKDENSREVLEDSEIGECVSLAYDFAVQKGASFNTRPSFTASFARELILHL